MSDSADWRAYAAPITAALIARLPADQAVTPQQAAELFEQVKQAIVDRSRAKPTPPAKAAPLRL